MKQYSCIIFIMINLQITPLWANEQTGHAVLITATETSVAKFSSKELRLLFLGYPVTRNNQIYKPLLNDSDKILYQVFLQKVMFMSENNYERKLVTRVFRHGGVRPDKYGNREVLIESIKNKSNTVTFVKSDYAALLDNIHVIQQLW